ncbi:MAG: glutaminase A [Alphaproteobacteria bacterium]|nr:glutaminase A [Alphaproteobacteria bacterium]
MKDIGRLLEEATERVRDAVADGKVATYIPELAKADPALVGIAVHTIDGDTHHAGDATVPFTLQSISKVFALAALMRLTGPAAALDGMPCEPSGDSFHSIVRLEEESGHPRNPLINAGAILVSSRLPGANRREMAGVVEGLLASVLGASVGVDDQVYASESATGYRNRALANYMQHFGLLRNAERACEAYFTQCALSLDAVGLARAGLFLANGGSDPISGTRVIDTDSTCSILALMAMCGLYDQVGRFALSVGIPAKSAVSGGILAIVPGRMAIATYGPALGSKGNSVAGMAMLEFLSRELDLSLFR